MSSSYASRHQQTPPRGGGVDVNVSDGRSHNGFIIIAAAHWRTLVHAGAHNVARSARTYSARIKRAARLARRINLFASRVHRNIISIALSPHAHAHKRALDARLMWRRSCVGIKNKIIKQNIRHQNA